MSDLVVSSVVPALVESIVSYGVVVKVGKERGLIQVPELSWDAWGLQDRIETICKVGDTIDVKILAKTDDQFSGSIKATTPELDPWSEYNRPVVGQKFKVRVVLLTDYGYLVKLPNFVITALLYDQCTEKLEIGQTIDVEISSVKYDEKKVSLKAVKR